MEDETTLTFTPSPFGSATVVNTGFLSITLIAFIELF
jgi:hypothetical protein